jgi:hypothetical protein
MKSIVAAAAAAAVLASSAIGFTDPASLKNPSSRPLDAPFHPFDVSPVDTADLEAHPLTLVSYLYNGTGCPELLRNVSVPTGNGNETVLQEMYTGWDTAVQRTSVSRQPQVCTGWVVGMRVSALPFSSSGSYVGS